MIVYIEKSPTADSRTANKNHHITFDEFSYSTDLHRADVANTMNSIAELVIAAGEKHDWTKKEKEDEFYKEFTLAKEKGKDFTLSDWCQYHYKTERHHLGKYVPDDVNLIDVLEMIADCTCAGMARSGQIFDLELKDEVLQKAFQNTCKLVKDMIKVKKIEDNGDGDE